MVKTRFRLLTVVALSAILSASAASASLAQGNERKPRPQDVARETARFESDRKGPELVADRAVNFDEATSAAVGPSFGTVEIDALAGDGVSTAADTTEGSAAGQCRYVEHVNGRGVTPYDRSHHVGTYWCYVYNSHITYRRSNTWGRTGPVCATTDARNWKMGGGAGYRWVKIHSEAWFSCTTPWWFPLNDSLWMQIAYNVFGNYAVEGSNT